MKRVLLFVLVPTLAFADSMIYVAKPPKIRTNMFQGPQAYVEAGGVKLDQPIAVAADDGNGNPVWTAIVRDGDLPKIATDNGYLGKGLDEVKVRNKAVYDKITRKQVALDNGTVVMLPGDAPVPVGAKVIATDLPAQTFAGWDAKSGSIMK